MARPGSGFLAGVVRRPPLHELVSLTASSVILVHSYIFRRYLLILMHAYIAGYTVCSHICIVACYTPASHHVIQPGGLLPVGRREPGAACVSLSQLLWL